MDMEEKKSKLEMMKELRELVLKELALKEELYGIIDNYPRLLTPEYEYQQKDEFWDKIKEMNAVVHKKEIIRLKLEELSRIDEIIKMLEKEEGEMNGNGTSQE